MLTPQFDNMFNKENFKKPPIRKVTRRPRAELIIPQKIEELSPLLRSNRFEPIQGESDLLLLWGKNEKIVIKDETPSTNDFFNSSDEQRHYVVTKKNLKEMTEKLKGKVISANPNQYLAGVVTLIDEFRTLLDRLGLIVIKEIEKGQVIGQALVIEKSELTNFGKLGEDYIEATEATLTGFVEKFECTGVNKKHNQTVYPLFSSGLEILAALIDQSSAENVNQAKMKRLLKNLIPELTVCAPGLNTKLQDTYRKLTFELDEAIAGIRADLVKQEFLTTIREGIQNGTFKESEGMEVHYATAGTNELAESIAINRDEDSYAQGNTSGLIGSYAENIRKKLPTIITPANVIQHILSDIDNESLSNFLEKCTDRMVSDAKKDLSKKFTDAIDEINQDLDRFGKDDSFSMNALTTSNDEFTEYKLVEHFKPEYLSFYLFQTVLQRLQASKIFVANNHIEKNYTDKDGKIYKIQFHDKQDLKFSSLSVIIAGQPVRIPLLAYCLEELRNGKNEFLTYLLNERLLSTENKKELFDFFIPLAVKDITDIKNKKMDSLKLLEDEKFVRLFESSNKFLDLLVVVPIKTRNNVLSTVDSNKIRDKISNLSDLSNYIYLFLPDIISQGTTIEELQKNVSKPKYLNTILYELIKLENLNPSQVKLQEVIYAYLTNLDGKGLSNFFALYDDTNQLKIVFEKFEKDIAKHFKQYPEILSTFMSAFSKEQFTVLIDFLRKNNFADLVSAEQLGIFLEKIHFSEHTEYLQNIIGMEKLKSFIKNPVDLSVILLKIPYQSRSDLFKSLYQLDSGFFNKLINTFEDLQLIFSNCDKEQRTTLINMLNRETLHVLIPKKESLYYLLQNLTPDGANSLLNELGKEKMDQLFPTIKEYTDFFYAIAEMRFPLSNAGLAAINFNVITQNQEVFFNFVKELKSSHLKSLIWDALSPSQFEKIIAGQDLTELWNKYGINISDYAHRLNDNTLIALIGNDIDKLIFWINQSNRVSLLSNYMNHEILTSKDNFMKIYQDINNNLKGKFLELVAQEGFFKNLDSNFFAELIKNTPNADLQKALINYLGNDKFLSLTDTPHKLNEFLKNTFAFSNDRWEFISMHVDLKKIQFKNATELNELFNVLSYSEKFLINHTNFSLDSDFSLPNVNTLEQLFSHCQTAELRNVLVNKIGLDKILPIINTPADYSKIMSYLNKDMVNQLMQKINFDQKIDSSNVIEWLKIIPNKMIIINNTQLMAACKSKIQSASQMKPLLDMMPDQNTRKLFIENFAKSINKKEHKQVLKNFKEEKGIYKELNKFYKRTHPSAIRLFFSKLFGKKKENQPEQSQNAEIKSSKNSKNF